MVVISPHNESIRSEFGAAFSRWHEAHHGRPAVVEWRDVGGSSEALRFVQSEFAKKPGGIGIDCFFGGGVEPHVVLAQKDLLEPITLPEDVVSHIPQKLHGLDLYDPKLRWYGAAISSFGLLQNLRIQQRLGLPEVSRWDDLADPRLEGWIGAGDPRTSGTMLVMFEGILQYHGWVKGWKILSQMAGNCRKFDRVSTTTAKDVTVGETYCGLAIDFYGFSQVAHAGRSNLSFVLPRDFVTLAPDPIAVLVGAPHPETSRRFLEFVLGEPGQKLWFFPRGHPDGAKRSSIERLPVRKELYERYPEVSNVGGSPFLREQTFRYNGKLARDRRDVLPALLGAVLVDTHSELQGAWRAILRRGMDPSEVDRFGAPPMAESELSALAAGEWKTQAVRMEKKIEWQRQARDKFRALAKSAARP